MLKKREKAQLLNVNANVEGVIIDHVFNDFLAFLTNLENKGFILSSDMQDLRVADSLEYKEKEKKEKLLPSSKLHVLETIVPDIYRKYNHNDIIKVAKDRGVPSLDDIEDITSDMWMPESVVYHDDDFFNWINSINEKFSKKIYYHPYALYCEQANRWFNEKDHIGNYRTDSEKFDYIMQELDRISCNSLYAANKYLYIPDATSPSGLAKYYCNDNYEHQRVQCFLIDCGYSIIEGKPRQVGDTTIKAAIAVFKMITRSNFFLKIIAEDKTTGEEIFDDKIKFSYSHIDSMLRPGNNPSGNMVLNDSDRIFRIGKKIKKGNDKGINSKIEVVSPSRTAINGGSPSIVFIDEADSVRELTEMMTEGRPTLYKRGGDGRLIQIRQIVIWSTGTSKQAGGGFEREWRRIIGLWRNKDFEAGIVPIFYDWSCRCDEEEYLRQKKYYYGIRSQEEGIDSEVSIVQFHQHYPSSPEDMFVSAAKTLIGKASIIAELNRIDNSTLLKNKPIKYGYFVPVYDKTRKRGENSEHLYEIIGAEFMPCDLTDPLYSATIFQDPEPGWVNRYYEGTDPISSDTGASKMASAIWDDHYKTISAVVNCRKANNPHETYLQSFLLGLYYDVREGTKKRVPELFERNIGSSYKDFIDSFGYRGSFLYDAQLKEPFQSGNKTQLGIDNRGIRNPNIISAMQQFFNTYKNRLFLRIIFVQLRTFVAKVTRNGNTTWGTVDTRMYDDDVLFAVIYAYICCDSLGRTSKKIDEEVIRHKMKYKLKIDQQGNLYREETPV